MVLVKRINIFLKLVWKYSESILSCAIKISNVPAVVNIFKMIDFQIIDAFNKTKNNISNVYFSILLNILIINM